MEYESFLEKVQELPFVRDHQTADAMVKAVLGILASRMEETEARQLSNSLPEPLNYERLRGHQRRTPNISVKNSLNTLCNQFNINHEEAHQLFTTVLHVTKEAVGQECFQDWEKILSNDWVKVMQEV